MENRILRLVSFTSRHWPCNFSHALSKHDLSSAGCRMCVEFEGSNSSYVKIDEFVCQNDSPILHMCNKEIVWSFCRMSHADIYALLAVKTVTTGLQIEGRVTCDFFTPFLTVFQSYQHDGRVTMKAWVQRNRWCLKRFPRRISNPGPLDQYLSALIYWGTRTQVFA